MFIEIDGVVRDYVFGMISSTLRMREVTNEKVQSKLMMSTIEFGSNVGFIEHKFSALARCDQFVATTKLIEDWNDIFPSLQLPPDTNARLKIKIVGKRDRFFKPGSFQPVATMANWRTLR